MYRPEHNELDSDVYLVTLIILLVLTFCVVMVFVATKRHRINQQKEIEDNIDPTKNTEMAATGTTPTNQHAE